EEADDVWSVIVNTKNGQTAPTSIIQKYMRLINEVDSLEDVISFRKKSIGNQLSILITPEMKSSKGSKVVKFQRPGEKGKQDRKIIEGHLENKFSEEHYKKSDFLQEAKQGDLQGHGFTNKELERMWQDAALYARAKRIGEAVASKEINALLKSDFAEFYDDKQKKFKKQLNDLKNKLKNLKDATKAEKKAIKKEMDAVKEAFTEYINESGLINVGVTKKLLKLAQETNSVKDLVKFINTADKYIERQLKSDLKRVIRQTITSIRRRAANGEYTNVKDDVIDLTEIPFDSIQDETLLMEVVATLALVDRDKVAIVNESSIRELIAKVETHRHQESTLEDVITENELKEIDKLSEEKQKDELEDKIASQHNKVLDIVKRIAEMDLDSDNIGVNEELKAARKEIRKLQRIINKYHDITHGDLSNIEYIKNSLNTLLDIHNKKVESYNRNKYNLAMDIVNNLTKEELSRFDKHQINAIEELKDTEFINDLQLIDNLLAVSFDLSYGYIPLSAMNDIANASIRAKHSQDVLKAIDDAVRDKAEKGVKEREMTEDELTNKIRKKNWGYLDYIYGIKNNVIAKYLTPLITRAEAMMKLDIEGARDKFTNAVKKLKGGRSQVEKTMIKLGMIAHQNQENLNFDNPRDIWGDIFYPNGEKQAIYSKRYKDKEDIYREIYESLPKTEDGRVDVGEAMKELNTQERDVLSTFKEIMDNDLKGKQRFVNESNGQGFQDFDGYIPIIGKGKYSNSGNVIEDTSSWLEKIFKNPKIKSDRGKVRSDRKTKAIQADLGILFNDSVTQVNRDYHFTPAIQKLSSILNGALSTADKHNSTADHINALKETFKTGVQGLFHTTFKNDLFSKAVQKGFSFTYAYKLARIWKNFIGDFIADSVKMNIKGMNKYSAEILIRGAKERAYVNMKKIGKFLRLSTGNPANNLTTFDKLLNISKSPFLMRYNKHLIEGSTDIGSSTKGGLADFMMGFGDRNTVHMIWMPKFMSEFKKNTGEKFNYNKFNSDPSYAEKHKKAIKEASAVADSLSIQWKDTPVKTARRADIQLPFGTAVDINSQWAPFLTYMTNYGFQEAMQTAMGLSKMKYGLGNIFRGNFKEGRSETWEGFRELTAVTVTGVGYGIIIGVEYSLTMMSLAALSGDDDEYEKWRQKALDSVNGNAILKHIVSHFSFLLSSKYGQASRTMLLSFLGYIVKNKMVNKEQEEWINKKTRELFYSNPITWDKYGNLNYGVEAIAPPLAMFFDISSNLGDNFKNWLNLLKEQSEYMGDAEGVYRDADTEQGKYRPELKWTKLGFSIAQFWFITKGMKIPIQKEVERTINHFDKIYDKSSSAKRVKGEKVNPTTFPWTTPEPSDTKDEKGGTRKGSRKRTRSSKR
ncbi:hypothetical protein H8D85_02280, partial [bacterium]|nr:hypothetical protein [bacterium]